MKLTITILAGLLALPAMAQEKVQLTDAEKLSIRELQLVISESAVRTMQAQIQFEEARKAGEEARQKLTVKLAEAQKAHNCIECQWSQDGSLVLIRMKEDKGGKK